MNRMIVTYVKQVNTVETGRSSVCDNCPAGKYLTDAAQHANEHDEPNDCDVCEAGTYSSSVGASSGSNCDIANLEHQDQSGQTSCKTCGGEPMGDQYVS